MSRAVSVLVVLAVGCAAPARHAERRDAGRTESPANQDEPAPARTGAFTLERAIERALEASPELGIARERIEQALASTSEANAAFLPSLDGRFAWTRTDDPLAGFGFLLRQRKYAPSIDPNHAGDQQDVRPDVVLQWNIFRGGADLENRSAALEGEEAAREGAAATRAAVTFAVCEAFFSVAKAEDLVPVAEEAVRAVEAACDDARARESVGKALAGDVLSLEARLAEAKEQLVRARNGVALARAGLRAILALPRDESLEIVVDRDSRDVAEVPDETAAIDLALEARPELRAVRAQTRALGHAATAASREANPLVPRLDAFATYGVDSSTMKFNGTADNWTVGVVADWNIFSGGRDAARARRADARLAEARETERKVELAIQLEVRRARLSLEEARERVKTTEDGVRAATEALRVVKEQFVASAVPVTRFLEAQVALRDARAREVVARADVRIARAALERALGQVRRPEGSVP